MCTVYTSHRSRDRRGRSRYKLLHYVTLAVNDAKETLRCDAPLRSRLPWSHSLSVSRSIWSRYFSTNSGVAFRVQKGDHVTGLTGTVITRKPGKVLVKKAQTIGVERKIRVQPGDILYTLHYQGEGNYKLWFRGKIYEEEMPTSPYLVTNVPIEQREEYLHVIAEPDSIWWVQVKNARGQTGWTKQNRHFGNMDACGADDSSLRLTSRSWFRKRQAPQTS